MSKPTTFKPPLSQPVFYVLLALVPQERHGYGIMRGANDLSLGEMTIAPGTVYPLLARLTEAGLVKSIGYSATANRDAPRKHYALTPQGLILIKSELRRLRHAVAVGEANGLFLDELPLDIQLLLAEAGRT